MSELGDLLSGADEAAPLTVRERAKRIDNAIHYTTLSKYQRGRHPAVIPEATIQLLARAYGLSADRVRRAAGAPAGSRPYTLPPEAHRLTSHQQDALNTIIRAMAYPHGARTGRSGDDGGGPEDQKSDEGGTVTDLPARTQARRPARKAASRGRNKGKEQRDRMEREWESEAVDPPGPEEGV